MKKISNLIIVLILVFTLTGCGYKKGDMYITLTSNSSTGFSWQSSFSKEGIIELVGSNYEEPDNNGMVGVAGKETFRYKALKEGEVTLTLKYKRQWEDDDETTYRINYVIKVDSNLKMKAVSQEGEYNTYDVPVPVIK